MLAPMETRTCGHCHKPFEIAPKPGGRNELYCSDPCRKEVIKRQKREAKKRLRERQARLR